MVDSTFYCLMGWARFILTFLGFFVPGNPAAFKFFLVQTSLMCFCFFAIFGNCFVFFSWFELNNISSSLASSVRRGNETIPLHQTLDHLLGPCTKYFTDFLLFLSPLPRTFDVFVPHSFLLLHPPWNSCGIILQFSPFMPETLHCILTFVWRASFSFCVKDHL